MKQESETQEKLPDKTDEVEESDEDVLPEKRARTSTRSDQFDYTSTSTRRTRRQKKAVVEEANVKFTSEEPLGKNSFSVIIGEYLDDQYV